MLGYSQVTFSTLYSFSTRCRTRTPRTPFGRRTIHFCLKIHNFSKSVSALLYNGKLALWFNTWSTRVVLQGGCIHFFVSTRLIWPQYMYLYGLYKRLLLIIIPVPHFTGHSDHCDQLLVWQSSVRNTTLPSLEWSLSTSEKG